MLKTALISITLALLLTACGQDDQASTDGNANAGPTTADGKYQVGDRLEAPAKAAMTELRTLEWDELVPQDYDPMVILEGVNLDELQDGDPRAQEMLDDLKVAMASAPPVAELDGQQVRLPGFAVPLEADEKEVREMLLVPYFGACIHVPPPPSNQIVHVFPSSPVEHELLYDAVWIEGTIKVDRSETKSGDASYTFKATAVKPYE